MMRPDFPVAHVAATLVGGTFQDYFGSPACVKEKLHFPTTSPRETLAVEPKVEQETAGGYFRAGVPSGHIVHRPRRRV